jgi:hypothetical protein
LPRTSASCCQGWKPIPATDAEKMFDKFRSCPTKAHCPMVDQTPKKYSYLNFSFRHLSTLKMSQSASSPQQSLWKKETEASLVWDVVRFELTTKTSL